MKTKNIVFIQARSSSSRFKGKVLEKINNRSLLEILILRIKKLKGLDKIVLCTTSKNSDFALSKLA